MNKYIIYLKYTFMTTWIFIICKTVYLKLLLNFYSVWKNSFTEEITKLLEYVSGKLVFFPLVHITVLQQIRTWQRDQMHPGGLFYVKVNMRVLLWMEVMVPRRARRHDFKAIEVKPYIFSQTLGWVSENM